MYSVKEIFFTLQGEGARSGRAAVFCRFTGCNLWTGREQDRASAECRFCDTDFVGTDGPGGGKFVDAKSLAMAVARAWPAASRAYRYVVLTGGEPLLQVDAALTAALHAQDFEIAVETNGTQPLPSGLDWVCVSPKAGTTIHVRRGQELKIVMPQPALDFIAMAQWDFEYFFVQPMDGVDRSRHLAAAIKFCQDHPQWRLSLQTHKIVGMP
jgi:7-carboxy-7-deazaguanine synthase